jgi:hypothetical protein
MPLAMASRFAYDLSTSTYETLIDHDHDVAKHGDDTPEVHDRG